MRLERIYLVSCEQSNALNAIADPDCTQKMAVEMLYDCHVADMIAKRDGTTRVDWPRLADAVLKRWPKGFERINDAVAKLVRQRSTPTPAGAEGR